MTHFAISHDFTGDIDTYWKVFFDEEFKTEQYRRINVKERTVLDRKEDEKTISFSERVVPARDLPGFMKKILGGDLGYTEISIYTKGANKIDVRIEPTLLRERTKMRALFTVVTTAPGKLRRTFEGDIDVDLALVGGKVERTVIDDIKRSYDIAAQVTQEWLTKAAAAK